MRPAEALWAVTSRAAGVCGLGHRRGRIAARFHADIFAIDGDPLEDLTALCKVRTIYINGISGHPEPAVPAPGTREVRARYLIRADGAHSTIRDQLDISTKDPAP
jgi:2-polyprenyl-6-methoxyphenol hydroxylase-like FAD-dependent oxidoreductase